jgi:hypothetical protein
MGPRGRQAREYARGQRGRLADRAKLNRVGAEWRRIPPRFRGWVPLLVLVSLGLTYPFYVSSLPSNVPLILTFPGLHSSVTILVFVVMAVGLNIVVGYAGLLDLGYVAFYAIGAYTAG